jgi:predicted metal-binding protein
MCAADKCQSYNSSWSCPPGCGTLEYFEQRFSQYKQGIAFQTVGQTEDSFDFEAIQAAGQLHKQRFNRLVESIRQQKADVMALSAGCCAICESCSYPDAPCRYPEKMCPSMEATGLLVNDICQAAGIAYNHGQNTITFTSCLLYS